MVIEFVGTKIILARLNELNDDRLFETSGAVRSFFSSTAPSVLRIYATQNDGVQRAVSILSLYNIYKEMFRCWIHVLDIRIALFAGQCLGGWGQITGKAKRRVAAVNAPSVI